MPVERRTPCPYCGEDTATATLPGLQVQHGECWMIDLRRKQAMAKPGSNIHRAITETLAAIEGSKS